MARQLRVQFPGAIYHLVTSGDGRKQLFHNQGHYERMTRGLKDEVTRSGWKVFAFGWMPNHLHNLVTISRKPHPISLADKTDSTNSMNRILNTLAALLLAATFAHAGENGPPNILLLYADDLGYGDLTCYD
ncbi:MAG: transposase, partial [Candidatus Paceibacterota bacterium]